MKKIVLALMLSIFVLGLGVSSAMADSIMFPWVIKNTNVTTLISVVQTSEVSATCRQGMINAASLHYQYWYKPACHPNSPAGQCIPNLTGICQEHNIEVPTSQNDIVSFDAAGVMNAGKPLFNDYPVPHSGRVNYGPNVDLSLATVIPSAARAFLLVDNNDSVCFEDEDQATLYGEAMVLELTNGAGWGYVAYNGVGGGINGPNSESTLGFSDGSDLQGEVLRSPRWNDVADNDGEELEATPTVLLPLATFKTKMFMTPINYTESNWDAPRLDDITIGARNPNSNARLQFCVDPNVKGSYPRPDACGLGEKIEDSCQSTSDPECTMGGIWDNDEVILSCQTCMVDVVCTGTLDINAPASSQNGVNTQLLNSSQITYLTTYGGQGWTYVRSMLGSFFGPDAGNNRNNATRSDMIVGKLEFTEGAFNVSGTAVGGELNDFKWIRNSGSLWDEEWDLLRGINQVIQSDGFGD